MRIRGVLLGGAGALMMAVGAAQAQSVDRFDDAVEHYVALHREAERHLDPQQLQLGDAESVLAYAAALREALCRVRPMATEGDVFAPAAAQFRQRIRLALRRHAIVARDLLVAMRHDSEPGARPPAVNQAFSWALGNLMPAVLIEALPALPDELQYRFVGKSLVLVDIHAGLVVDILRAALDVAPFE